MPDLVLIPNARLFVQHPELREDLGARSDTIELARDELFHPPSPADFVVRLGRLRLTEFLPDGREVTHSVLQSGSCFTTCDDATGGNSTYPLDRTTLMALGDAEVWRLPGGALDDLNIL